ncbi:unnamed protein product [Prunus brigantina]
MMKTSWSVGSENFTKAIKSIKTRSGFEKEQVVGELVRALGGVPPQIREAILCGSTKSTTEEGSTAPISVR